MSIADIDDSSYFSDCSTYSEIKTLRKYLKLFVINGTSDEQILHATSGTNYMCLISVVIFKIILLINYVR